MKYAKILSALFVLSICNVSAQNTFPATGSAGIGTAAPNASALLDMVSTSKGLLAPRMTKTQRDAIATPATGLMIYQTNSTPGFYYYSGTAWTAMSAKGANTALANLVSPTGVNQILQPNADNTIDFGTSAKAWKDLYLKGGLYFNGVKMWQYRPGVNTIIGENAGSAGTGGYNTAIGSNVLNINTTGNANVAIGENSLVYNTTGSNNTATGYAALINNNAGSDNVANGYQALYNNSTGSGNTAVGKYSLFTSTTTNENTALGSYSLYANTTGNSNTAIGTYAMESNTSGFSNTATGNSALYANTTGINNAAFGAGALSANTTGFYNTATGKSALQANTNGFSNVAAGALSLNLNTTGHENTASGAYSLQNNITGNYNAAFGAYSLQSNTSGYNNTATGYSSLLFNTTGYSNTATGYSSLQSNTTGYENTANGVQALNSNSTGNYNTATGGYALQANTTGNGNTADGFQALQSNTTGGDNTAVGELALWVNINGNSNVAIGGDALLANTTGSWNTAIGSSALGENINGNDNTAIGHTTLNSNTGSNNTAVGADALRLSGNGNQNSALGVEALFNNYDGNNNTAFGYKALWTNYLGSWNTCVGDRADVSTTNLSGATSFGTQAITNADNKIVIGASGVATMVIGGYKPWSNLSDCRFKEQVKENVPGLTFIKKLRPVTYTVNVDKLQRHITAQMPDSIARNYYPDANAIASAKKYFQTGFIAQEVEKTAKEINYQFDGVNAPQNPTDNYSIAYSQFVPSLVKAVQELSNENEEQKKINTDLQNQIDELKLLIQLGNQQSININQTSASLEQNIPNPFNQSATINYTLPAKFSSAKIVVTDNNGKTIKQFTLSSSGKGAVSIAAGALASGLYHYALYVDGKMVDNKKMEIIR
ncbi:MAG TPA: tail fiber domain-containing protein [Panacibacter sp.]|nr:tail fiber domain-containing protein [Panacibacter sp.]